MALQDGRILYAPFLAGRVWSDTLAYNSMLVDAAGENVSVIFRAPKTGTITTLRFRLATTTTGQTLRGGIYTVDAAGLPTTTAFGGMTAGTVAVANADDNVEKVITLAVGAAVTEGDIVSARIDWNSTVGNLNIVSLVRGISAYTAVYHNGAKQPHAPVMAVGYSDGSYPHIPGFFPFTGGIATTGFQVGSSPDEIALLFSVPFRSRLCGMAVNMNTVAGANFEFINYNGTSIVNVGGTDMMKLFDGDLLLTNGLALLCWDVSEELPANTQRRIAVRPTTASSIGVNFGTVGTAAARDTYRGEGSDWAYSARTNQGAWDEAAFTTRIPMIIPIFDALDDGATAGGGPGRRSELLVGGGRR